MNKALDNAVHPAPRGWFKSSFSSANGLCVEVYLDTPGIVKIRDSKYRQDPANDLALEPILTVSIEEWMRMLAAVEAGDPIGTDGALLVIDRPDEGVMLRCADDLGGPELAFTAQEWSAFVSGVGTGEFAPAMVPG